MQKSAHRFALTFTSLVVVCALSACTQEGGPPAGGAAQSLDVRVLNIVDEQGQVRMRLGAPLPDPKGAKRAVTAYGIQFLDATGREVGGLAMLEPRGMRALCFDTDEAHEALCLTLVNGQPQIMLGDNSSQRITLGVKDGVASVELADAQGTPHLLLAVDKEGKTRVEGVNPVSVSK